MRPLAKLELVYYCIVIEYSNIWTQNNEYKNLFFYGLVRNVDSPYLYESRALSVMVACGNWLALPNIQTGGEQ